MVGSFHDPHTILFFYVQSIAECGGIIHITTINVGCPTIIRSDHGTGNCLVATTQMALRHSHVDQW